MCLSIFQTPLVPPYTRQVSCESRLRRTAHSIPAIRFIRVAFIGLLSVFFTHGKAQSSDYKLIYHNGKVGMATNGGQVLIREKYENLGWSNYSLRPVNGVVGYKQGGRWGLLSLSDETVLAPSYSQLYPSGHLLVAAKKGKYSFQDFLGLIDFEGKNILPYRYASVQVTGFGAIVGTKTKTTYQYGVVDKAGRQLLPLKFKEIWPLHHLLFAAKDANGKIGIYNEKGEPTTRLRFDEVSGFANGYARVRSNYLTGLIDTSGIVKVPPRYKDIRLRKTPEVIDFDEWQLIDGREITRSLRFDHIEAVSSEHYKISAGNYQWIIDKNNQNVIPVHFDRIEVLGEYTYLFKQKNKWGVLKESRILIAPTFDSLFRTDEIFYAFDGRKWSLYDEFGIKKNVYDYDEIGEPAGYYFPVRKNDRWGYIDRKGVEVIPCTYEEVGKIVFNHVVVKFHGQYGIVDKAGDWVVFPQDSKLEIIDRTFYLAFDDQRTTLKSYDEGTIYFTENKVEVRDGYLLEQLSDGGLWKIDFNGRIVNREIPQQRFQEVRASSEALFAVKYDGRFGFVDQWNRLIVANRYEEVGDFSEGLVAVRLLGRWGFIDRQENIVVQPMYHHVEAFHNGRAIVENDEGYGLIDTNGRNVSAFGYDQITLQPNGRYIIRKGDKFGLLDASGRLLIHAKYDDLRELKNNSLLVSLFGKYGVLSPEGTDSIPIVYDHIIFNEYTGEYLAKKKATWKRLW